MGMNVFRGRIAGQSLASSNGSRLDEVLDEFTAAWRRGERPRAETFATRLDPAREDDLVELVYREFCLASEAGLEADETEYLTRFPALADRLERLLLVHRVFHDSAELELSEELDGLLGSSALWLPEAGDAVGPYHLVRELGRGAFARVFLAEQTDLDDRLVVLKVSSRLTPEPRLLARARHPNIVEVLWHREVESKGLQVVCLPFLGGATLAGVLDARRAIGRRARSGRDLLDALDRAATPFQLPGSAHGPARELIGGLRYLQSVAWIVARLAEALGHAFSRGVLHGDVKPSNILLTSDATPMLFDFNLSLSVGWRPASVASGRRIGPETRPAEKGGTLAYMAPERKVAIGHDSHEHLSSHDRHRSDIYSLGKVLLEMLTGRAAVLPESRSGPPGLWQFSSFRIARGAIDPGPDAIGLESVPSGLRAILGRCLAADPADRYGRAEELAEDLDRWRTNRPLVYAVDRGSASRLLRWADRQKPAFAAAAAGIATSIVAAGFCWSYTEALRRDRATSAYIDLVEIPEGNAFRTRQKSHGILRGGRTRAEVAHRSLQRFGVLGDEEWQGKDQVAGLEPARREELLAWISEQALRYSHALAGHPDSPADWRQALFCLERVQPNPRGPLGEMSERLRARLGLASSPGMDRRDHAPGWQDVFLRGVATEIEDEAKPSDELLEKAMAYYEEAISERPDFFWGHYRASAVARELATRLSKPPVRSSRRAQRLFAIASERISWCVAHRPESAVLKRMYAYCLFQQSRFDEALAQCDKAIGLEPVCAQAYLERAIFRLKLGQLGHYSRDLAHYEALTGRSAPRVQTAGFQFPGPSRDEVPEQVGVEGDVALSEARRSLGDELARNGQRELAVSEYDRALEADPDNLAARVNRAGQYLHLGRDGSTPEYESVVNHPEVDNYVQEFPPRVSVFHRVAQNRMREGKVFEAIETAEKGKELSLRFHFAEPESGFVLAKAYALAAQSEPTLRSRALYCLSQTYRDASDSDKLWIRQSYENIEAFSALKSQFGLAGLFGAH